MDTPMLDGIKKEAFDNLAGIAAVATPGILRASDKDHKYTTSLGIGSGIGALAGLLAHAKYGVSPGVAVTGGALGGGVAGSLGHWMGSLVNKKD